MSRLVEMFENRRSAAYVFGKGTLVYDPADVTHLLAHAKALETLLTKFHAGVIYCPACHRHMNPPSHTADCALSALLRAE